MTETNEAITITTTNVGKSKEVFLGHVWDCRKHSKQGTTVSDAWKEGKLYSIAGEGQQKRLPIKVIFINTSQTQDLVLCWISSTSKLHHFYPLRPQRIHEEHTFVGDAFGLFLLPPMTKEKSKRRTTSPDDAAATTTVSETTRLLPSAGITSKNEKINNDHDNHNNEQNLQIVAAYRPMTCRLPNDTDDDLQKQDSYRVRHIVVVSPSSSSKADDDDGSGPNKIQKLSNSTSNVIRRCLCCCAGNNKKRVRRRGCTSCGCCIDNDNSVIADEEEEKSRITNNSLGEDWIVNVTYEVIKPTTPYDTTTKEYLVGMYGPWTLRCEPGCWESDCNIKDVFLQDLQEATRRLPSHAQAQLPLCTTLWCNKSQRYGPCQEDPIVGKGACFHPHATWLKRNGERIEKQGGVEFYSMTDYMKDRELWGPGGLILHELCHAYHFKFIKDGYYNASIHECYGKAMSLKLYDSVPVHGPQGPTAKAYACTNAQEYFAELSVAFLSDGYDYDRDDDYVKNNHNKDDVHNREHDNNNDDEEEYNKWYPFHRTQLRTHDPNAYQLFQQLWSPSSTS